MLNKNNNGTCSLENPKDFHTTYALSKEYFRKAYDCGKFLTVYIPNSVAMEQFPHSHMLTYWKSFDPLFDFIAYHNLLNQEEPPTDNLISSTAIINIWASIGNEGMRYAKCRTTGRVISMKHMGNVVIGEEVVVGANSSIARATLDSTIIGDFCKIGCGVQIGHNCIVGERTILIDGVVLLGSSRIGNDCYIGGNAVIRNGVDIAENTFVGMGAVVTGSIKVPGKVWVGNPAKPLRDWDGEWA